MLRINGISTSSSMSSTMKSIGNMNFFVFTNTSSITHLGCLMDLYAYCSEIVVGLGLLSPNFLKTKHDIKLTFATGSHKGLEGYEFSIVQWIVQLHGSFCLGASFFCNTELHFYSILLSHVLPIFSSLIKYLSRT